MDDKQGSIWWIGVPVTLLLGGAFVAAVSLFAPALMTQTGNTTLDYLTVPVLLAFGGVCWWLYRRFERRETEFDAWAADVAAQDTAPFDAFAAFCRQRQAEADGDFHAPPPWWAEVRQLLRWYDAEGNETFGNPSKPEHQLLHQEAWAAYDAFRKENEEER